VDGNDRKTITNHELKASRSKVALAPSAASARSRRPLHRVTAREQITNQFSVESRVVAEAMLRAWGGGGEFSRKGVDPHPGMD
jgi:hypothetical protein